MAEKKKRGPGRPPGSKNKKTSSKSSSAASSAPKSKHEHILDMQMKIDKDRRTIDVIWSVTLIALGIFLLFTVLTDSTGAFGKRIHDVCLGLFGFMAYVLPFFFFLAGILLIMKKLQHIGLRTSACSILIFFMLCTLNSYRFIDENKLAFGFEDIVKYYKFGVEGKYGGAVGMEIGSLLVKGFGKPGLIIFAVAVLIICIFLVADTPISKFFKGVRDKREAKKILKELSDAETSKVQQAVAATARSTSSMDYAPAQDMEIAPPLNSKRTIFGGRAVDMQDTIVQKKESLQPDSGNFQSEMFDTEQVGKPAGTSVKKTGFGLGNSEDFGHSGTYGLGLDDGYSSNDYPGNSGQSSFEIAKKASAERRAAKAAKTEKVKPEPAPKRIIKTGDDNIGSAAVAVGATAASNAMKAKDSDTDDVANELTNALSNNEVHSNYKLPPVSLLKRGSSSKQMMTNFQLEERADLLEQTLRDFGVHATVLSVTQGASVTRYEVQPATGVKVSSITKLSDDIALNLRAKSIRIEAPIPGKAAVGIEVENDKPSPVLVRDLIESEEFANAKSKISFVVGKDISGQSIVSDLKDMPHLLIAGATGSGKSVCINTIIASFLYKARPDELKLIMIDPKVVELQHYNGIPHMLTPVVTDPRKASRALAIAVQEMDKRYELFAQYGVKDLESFNDYMRGENEPQNCKPQIVIIIDELADLMMAAPSEVENSICRLAQKARAAGMHLIVATQRPSVDVVTGLIKANIPSRIAFSVSSQFDSRTILDTAGAEKLLGKGDMLYSPVGSNKPYRVQGPYISDSETDKLIKFVKDQGGKPVYDEELKNAIESNDTGRKSEPEDVLTDDAIAFILKSKQASVSMLQRRFRIGYNRAARIIDEIEAKGIIGPSDGSRPRQVLITEDEYYGTVDKTVNEDVEPDVVEDESGDNELEYVIDESAVDAFDSLPESVQREIMSSDD